MSLDPRTFPTPVEPEWKADQIWAWFYGDDEEPVFLHNLVFEYHIEGGDYTIQMLDGFQYDREQAEEIVLNHLKINNADFIY